MATIPPKSNNGSRLTVPAGNFQAVLYGVWDIGFQVQEWKGAKKVVPKVVLAWEISKKISEGDFAGKRYTISKTYTFNYGDKANLRKDIESWLGRNFTEQEKNNFDLDSLLRKNCFLNIAHNESNGKKYANVKAITPLIEGLPDMVPETPADMPKWVADKRAHSVSPDYDPNADHDAQEPVDGGDMSFTQDSH
jgi:hypothetical protein